MLGFSYLAAAMMLSLWRGPEMRSAWEQHVYEIRCIMCCKCLAYIKAPCNMMSRGCLHTRALSSHNISKCRLELSQILSAVCMRHLSIGCAGHHNLVVAEGQNPCLKNIVAVSRIP